MSNKEEQKKRKEQLQQAARRKEKIQGLLIKTVIAVMIPLTAFVFFQGMFRSATVLPPDVVGEGDHVRGNESADLVITVYADFQCPSCLDEMEIVARAWPRIEDKVQYVFRYFPLDTHRHSFASARYAEAAGRQDKFWQMHDILFVNQALWSNVSDASVIFDGYAVQLGLDLEQLALDLDEQSLADKIIANQQGGIRAGVRGTPAMFFNGELMPTPKTSGELISMIDMALASTE